MKTTDLWKPIREQVGALLLQYRQYLALDHRVQELERSKMTLAAKLAKCHDVRISEVLRNADVYPELSSVAVEVAQAEAHRQQISDAMTFPDHIVWTMYKYEAYRGTAAEIRTMGHLRAHCRPKDYICSKRFRFLNSYLRRRHGTDLTDHVRFPESTDLSRILMEPMLVNLLEDPEFMSQWRGHEYFQTNGRLQKWADFRSDAATP